MQKQQGRMAFLLIPIAFALLGIVGWILNIATILHADFSNMTSLLLVRLIGIVVAPIGAVLGYV